MADSSTQQPTLQPQTNYHCCDCNKPVEGTDYFTDINLGCCYGRGHVFVCDDCMSKDSWKHWRDEHWPNWPRVQ